MGARLQIWWIPQVPMKAFEYPVPTVEAGKMLLDVLAQYDSFQYENNVKPDYANAGGLVWCHDEGTDGEWWDLDFNDEDEIAEFQKFCAV